jgi:L-ribulokinase
MTAVGTLEGKGGDTVDETRYVVGVDFGTESGAGGPDRRRRRAMNSRVRSTSTVNGVIDERLPAPDGDVVLGPDWALQDPNDYIETFKRAVPAVRGPKPA